MRRAILATALLPMRAGFAALYLSMRTHPMTERERAGLVNFVAGRQIR